MLAHGSSTMALSARDTTRHCDGIGMAVVGSAADSSSRISESPSAKSLRVSRDAMEGGEGKMSGFIVIKFEIIELSGIQVGEKVMKVKKKSR